MSVYSGVLKSSQINQVFDVQVTMQTFEAMRVTETRSPLYHPFPPPLFLSCSLFIPPRQHPEFCS